MMIANEYKTSDDKSFTNLREAEKHEEWLWERYFTQATVDVYEALLTLNDSEKNEYYGTPREIFKELVRDYFTEAGILPTVMGQAV